jgi:hypothetical protein
MWPGHAAIKVGAMMKPAAQTRDGALDNPRSMRRPLSRRSSLDRRSDGDHVGDLFHELDVESAISSVRSYAEPFDEVPQNFESFLTVRRGRREPNKP